MYIEKYFFYLLVEKKQSSIVQKNEKENKNIKYFGSVELFYVKDVPQMKDKNLWFANFNVKEMSFKDKKKNWFKNMKIYVENIYMVYMVNGNYYALKIKKTSMLK